ncbi:NAD(P)-dependent oxidoreductase [Mesorhizobium sp.]|uniref:NAD(P)-dependent oxidoreductase n=1 Tax=Mesorhizobium sp. TaxID=1871066 RepID=UPI0025B8D904|nr:NAD(P)-dependent oxidoreductase [Mesorhizobium sp.]
MTDPGANNRTVAFIGLGNMGLPMARRLLEAGFAVRGSDVSPAARAEFQAIGGQAFDSAPTAVGDSCEIVLMLPNSAIVRDVILGANGIARVLKPGTLLIDMSSSVPVETRKLAQELEAQQILLIDAPVSGGVKRAMNGTLAIMAGGDEAQIERARPLLAAMGSKIVPTGSVGSGHAVKALNNYVSAAGLAAACEATVVARAFGIDPDVFVDALNVSTGRNNATEYKMKPFVLSGTFASGFSMSLMAKDIKIADELADHCGLHAQGIHVAAELWAAASAELGTSADHTEIERVLARARGT